MKIDNTALVAFQTCPALYFLRFKQGWAPRRKSAALGFGGGVHLGLQQWYENELLDTESRLKLGVAAMAEGWTPGPIDDYRTLEKAVELLVLYSKQYPRENFNLVQGPSGPLVEVVFTLPLVDILTGEQLFCDDGEPIEYGGIFDGLVDSGGPAAQHYVLEHKTTSRLGPSYMYQFKPNNQLSGYIWAGWQLSGRKVAGALINAMCVTSGGKIEFRREITTRTEYDLHKWAKDVQATCNLIRRAERTNEWPRFTKNCTMYGRCEFHEVHTKGDPATEQRVLEQDYEIRHWSHESRDEVVATND